MPIGTAYRFSELTPEAQSHAVTTLIQARAQAGWNPAERRDIATTMLVDLAANLQSPGWERAEDIPGITLVDWRTEHPPFIALDGTLTRDTAPDLPWPADDRVTGVLLAPAEAGTNTGVIGPAGGDLAEPVRALDRGLADKINHALDAGVEQAEWLASEEVIREKCESHEDVWLYLADGTPYTPVRPDGGRHSALAGDDPGLRRAAAWITTVPAGQLDVLRRILNAELDHRMAGMNGQGPYDYIRSRIGPGYTWFCRVPSREWVTEPRFGWTLSREGRGDHWRLLGHGVDVALSTSYLGIAIRRAATAIREKGLVAREPGQVAETHPSSDGRDSP